MNAGSQSEKELFGKAMQFANAEERAAFLIGACGGNDELRRRIEGLFEAHNKLGDFLAESLVGAPSKTVALSSEMFAPVTARPGDRIGRYRLYEQIGEGGCGIVYVAEQEEPIRRRVALKVIKLGMDTRGVVARFEAERQALALMDHPNIAKVLDAGTTENGRPFFVMELVRGIRITSYCDQNNLSTEERLKLFIQVCSAVQHAHQKGIIHRDIKPSNILVTLHDGVPVPKVIDFGIAKATSGQRLTDKTIYTAFEQFIGTPAYMSPEQAEMSGLDIDTRTDVYSLGVLLYELLTDKTPFDPKRLLEAGLDEIRRIIREEEPPWPSTRIGTLEAVEQTTVARRRRSDPPKLLNTIRGDLDSIVMKSLEKDRTRRFETVNALATDVQRHLSNEPVVSRPPSQFYRFERMVQRNKLAFGAACAVVTSLAIGLGVSTYLFLKQRKTLYMEEQERRRAVSAEQGALSQATRAEAASVETKGALSTSDFLQAVRLISQSNFNDAVAYLTRSLSANPRNEAALTRLLTLLTCHAWTVPTVVVRHSGVIGSAQFSPDGKRILTASHDGTARVWDAESGQPLTEPMRHNGWLNSAEFSPNGRYIVTASEDFTARVWDSQSGQPLTEPLKHGFTVLSAHFSPDGRRIAIAEYNKTARVWDAQSGQPLTEPLRHGGPVGSAEFSADGTRIVTASWGDGTARVWDAQSGRPLTPPLKHKDQVHSAHFSPDGKLILTSSIDGTAQVWDAQTGKALMDPMKGFSMGSAEFRPDGKRIVTTSTDTARVWDAQTGQPLTEPLKHDGIVDSAEFSPDGRRIVTTCWDGTAHVWDAQTGQPVMEPLKHNGRVRSAHFSPDGQRILTASYDGTARVWDVVSGQALTEPLEMGPEVTFSQDGKRMLTVSWDRVHVWDVVSGQPLTVPLKHKGQVSSAKFSPDGKRIVTTSFRDTVARVWDAANGQPVAKPLRHSHTVLSAQFSADGTRIATASNDRTARVWDAQTGFPVTPPLRHGGFVSSAQFSADGTRVVTASGDGTARVWDTSSGQPLTQPLTHNGEVRAAHFSPDGSRVVTASADKTARMWDAWSGQPVTDPLKHSDEVDAQFSSDGKWVITTSSDGRRIWDPRSGQALTEPLLWLLDESAARLSSDGKRIVTVPREGPARLWKFVSGRSAYPDWLVLLAEAISGRVLNKSGVLEESSKLRGEALRELRERLKQEPGNDDWIVWGRWFLASPSTRYISPFSRMGITEFLEACLSLNNTAGLAEAEKYGVDKREFLGRIARRRELIEAAKQADVLQKNGKLAEAEKLLRGVLIEWRQVLSNNHPSVAHCLRDLGDVLNRQGKAVEAEPLLREALAFFNAGGTDESGDGDLVVRSLLGACMLDQKKYKDAEALLLPCYDDIGDNYLFHPDLRSSVRRKLSQLYSAAGWEKNAAEWKTKLMAEVAAPYQRRIECGEISAINLLARELATSTVAEFRNGPIAVGLAERTVIATDWKDAAMLDTLAAAYAEAGRFADAVMVQKQAMVLLNDQGQRERYGERLKVYEGNLPWREY